MKKINITIYSSEEKTNLFKELRNIFFDIKKSNFLATQIAKRDIQAQYRQSYFGLVWAFLPVIVNSLVWIFLNSSGAVTVNSPNNIPYALYVILGSTIWSVFVESLQLPINSINEGKGIVSKINFPKEALLISGYYKFLFSLLLKLIVAFVFIFLFGAIPNHTFLLFPLLLLIISLFGSAIGLILTPIGLLYSDISRIITISTQFLMYITPVVYMAPKVGWSKMIFNLNPLTYLINDTRNSLIGLPVENFLIDIIIGIISLIVFLIGLVFLRKSMNIIIEKIS